MISQDSCCSKRREQERFDALHANKSGFFILGRVPQWGRRWLPSLVSGTSRPRCSLWSPYLCSLMNFMFTCVHVYIQAKLLGEEKQLLICLNYTRGKKNNQQKHIEIKCRKPSRGNFKTVCKCLGAVTEQKGVSLRWIKTNGKWGIIFW